MEINRTENATRNMVFGIVLKVYQIAIPFFLRSMMVYTLGVEYLGLNSLFSSVLQVLSLAELGVGSAMVYSMYKPIVEDDKQTICAMMNLYKWYYRIIGAVILIIGGVLTPVIPRLIKEDVSAGISIYVLYLLNLIATVFTYWLFAYRNSVLQAHQRSDIASKTLLCTDSIKYILQIAAMLFLRNYYAFVLAMLFTQVLNNVLTAIISKKLYPEYSASGNLPREQIACINKKIRDLFTAKLGGTIVASADTLVISAYLGLTELAVYQNYYFIMMSIVGFISVLLTSCTAGIGNSIIVESKDKNYKDFKKFAFMEIWVVGICVCCFLNLYQPFMIIWMGKDYLLNFGCVILFCLYFYLYITNQYMCTYKDAAGIWHEDRFRPLVTATANLVINLLLVKHIGIFAILLSTILSYLFIGMPWLIKNLFSTLFKRSCGEFLRKYLHYTFVIAIACIVTYLMTYFIDSNSMGFIILRTIVTLFGSNLVFLIFFRKDDEFEETLDLVDRITKNRSHAVTKILKK